MDQPSGQGAGAGLEHGTPQAVAEDAPGTLPSPVVAETQAGARHADRDAGASGFAPSGMADAGAGGSNQQGSPGSQRQGDHPGAAGQHAAYRAAEQEAGQDSWATDAAWQQGSQPARQGWGRPSLNITA